MQLQIKTITVLMIVGLFILPACNDFLDIQPPADEIVPGTLFQQPDAIEGLVNDMYQKYGSYSASTGGTFSVYLAFAADEIYPGTLQVFEELTNNTYDAEDNVLGYWSNAYKVIYVANTLLENLPNVQVLSDKTRRQYEAEARFMRAYCYFYLVNVYGGVPLVQKTDPGESISMARTPAEEVWAAVVDDLEQALDLAPADFDDAGRANQWAIRAMLARVYLYRENWEQAEVMATEVIEDSPFSLDPDLTAVFSPDNTGAICAPPIGSIASYLEKVGGYPILIPSAIFGPPSGILRPGLVNAFESGDDRLDQWTTAYGSDRAVYKYINPLIGANVRTEYLIYLRIAEQYLIRAEARARQNNVTGVNSAESDVNEIRDRAGLGGTAAATETDMLDAIMQERRIELFVEGQRWFDLKRTGRIDVVLGTLKSTWEPYKKLFPIPQSEMNANPRLEPNPDW